MGGGIFTKAAAVGAAISVLYEYRSEEDDERIPASITDIVDDTVGVTARLGVVLIGTFAEATCVALFLAASSDTLGNSWKAQRHPVVIFSLLEAWWVFSSTVLSRVRDEYGAVEKALKTLLSPPTLPL